MAKKKANIKEEQSQIQSEIVNINIDNLLVGGNPRKYFNEKALLELAESIKQVGIIQPIVVRETRNAENMYSIIAGERRYRAAKLAGLQQMPACIRECTTEEALDIALSENLQREDMTELETAETIMTMIELKKLDIYSIAVKLGKSEKYVRDRYQLNNLTEDFKNMLSDDLLNIGKAIFITSYPQDLQDLIYKDHFSNEHWNYWAELSLKKFESHLDNRYNSNLDKAEFDTQECKECPFNSSFGQLFSDDTARCLKKSCYSDKQENSKFSKIAEVIEENPSAPLYRQNYVSDWVVKKIEENGFEFSEGNARYFPTEPEKPEAPKEEDFADEETAEIDQNEFNQAMEEYEQECKDYEEDLKEYVNDVLEIENKLKSGEYETCLILSNSSVSKGYAIPDTETGTDDIDTDKQEIGKLQTKLSREQELKVEKSVKDLKEQVFKGSIDFTKPAIKLEQDILFYFLLSDLTREHEELFFGEKYAADKIKFDFIVNMSPEQRTVIIRDYVLSNLKSHAFNSHSVATQLFLEFSKYHFEKETADIEKTHQDVFIRRKGKIDEKLKALGINVLADVNDTELAEEPEEVNEEMYESE
ncbi:MAG: ParB/RepB/Spo0J family partition protein [Prevotella sp.]|jgi:ParB family chromosome partitioning protein|nr:ParB/RepB/Spo0J family partition protein [Prevotella sp.]